MRRSLISLTTTDRVALCWVKKGPPGLPGPACAATSRRKKENPRPRSRRHPSIANGEHVNPPLLKRVAFKTSRLLDFTNQRELTAQIGHEVEAWPLVASRSWSITRSIREEAGTAPEITVAVDTTRGQITVADNGPGIPAKTSVDILDFSERGRAVRPTLPDARRARQCAENPRRHAVCFDRGRGSRVGETVIESRGTAHRLVFTGDPVRRNAQVSHDKATPSVKNGHRVTLRWPQTACHALVLRTRDFLRMVADFWHAEPAPRTVAALE